MKASGQETVRSFQQADADSANKQTPLELIQQGDQIIVRTNQDKVSDRVQPNADLEISVPEGSSIEAHGRYGDFDIQGINGNVNINSDNAGVRLENLGGNVQIDTRASDTIRAVDVKGNVELKGRGEDVELQNIAGLVTVNGVYVGEIQLSNLAQPLRWEDPQNSMGFEKLPGQVRMSRGRVHRRQHGGSDPFEGAVERCAAFRFHAVAGFDAGPRRYRSEARQESAEDGSSHAIGRHRRWRCRRGEVRLEGFHRAWRRARTNMAIRCTNEEAGHGATRSREARAAARNCGWRPAADPLPCARQTAEDTTTFPDIPSAPPNPPNPPLPSSPECAAKVEHQ